MQIHVSGEQWWWRVTYPDLGVTTANEIHVPVGTPVDITLTSDNVIHSFWVPQLNGKTDLIPGQTNHLSFTPTRPAPTAASAPSSAASSTPRWRSS